MPGSTTAGHVPCSALELCRAETTVSASQLEAYLQAAPVELQFMFKDNTYSLAFYNQNQKNIVDCLSEANFKVRL
jgi:hypothetical protein